MTRRIPYQGPWPESESVPALAERIYEAMSRRAAQPRTVLIDGEPREFLVLICPPQPAPPDVTARPKGGTPISYNRSANGKITSDGTWVRAHIPEDP